MALLVCLCLRYLCNRGRRPLTGLCLQCRLMRNTTQSLVIPGLLGRCPACAEGQLFSGFLAFSKTCEACNASFEMEDAGDGPAIFVIFIVGIFIIPMVLTFQFVTDAPTWLTLLIWGPIIIIACLFLLRLMRGVLFTLQYKNKAREVRSKDIKK